jgi:hypothetical protein
MMANSSRFLFLWLESHYFIEMIHVNDIFIYLKV